MIGYTLVGTNDLERAKRFYDALFDGTGATRTMETPRNCIWGTGWDKPMFGVVIPYDGAAAVSGNGTMSALVFEQRAQVDAMHAKAMSLDGTDEGAPGVRGEEGDHAFYAAYFRDPDGNKLCAYRVGPA